VHRNVSDSEGITANEISLSELSLEVVQVFVDPSVCVGSAVALEDVSRWSRSV
jgi:hypothetical protein